MFNSKLSRNTKTKLYITQNITYIRPIFMYGYETWLKTKGDEGKLLTFEKKSPKDNISPTQNLDTGEYQ